MLRRSKLFHGVLSIMIALCWDYTWLHGGKSCSVLISEGDVCHRLKLRRGGVFEDLWHILRQTMLAFDFLLNVPLLSQSYCFSLQTLLLSALLFLFSFHLFHIQLERLLFFFHLFLSQLFLNLLILKFSLLFKRVSRIFLFFIISVFYCHWTILVSRIC